MVSSAQELYQPILEVRREHALLVCSATEMVTPKRAASTREALSAAKRIAVITKFRFMGDTVVATPFITQLREHFPAAAIDLLAAPVVETALANCPSLNRIIPVDMNGVSRWQHGKDLNNILKSNAYDVAFVLNRSLHCAVTAALSRVPVRIGYANELRRFLLTVPIPYVFDRNEVDCHLDMLRSIGLASYPALPQLWVTNLERSAEIESLQSRGIDTSRPIIGVQPGANDPFIREWGAEKYARVADQLSDELNGSVILMGGGSERKTADAMAAMMKRPVVNLVGELGLRSALATIGLCSLWLGNDTGLLHCAVAQHIPSVGVFGPNKVVRWGYDCPMHRSLVHFPALPADTDEAVRKSLDTVPETEMLETAHAVLAAEKEYCADPNTVGASTLGESAPYFAVTHSAAYAGAVRRR